MRDGEGQGRYNVRLPPDIKDALKQLQTKRYEDIGVPFTLHRLVVEGICLLLRREGIVPGVNSKLKQP